MRRTGRYQAAPALVVVAEEDERKVECVKYPVKQSCWQIPDVVFIQLFYCHGSLLQSVDEVSESINFFCAAVDLEQALFDQRVERKQLG